MAFIVASVDGLVGTGAGAPMGRPRGRGSVASRKLVVDYPIVVE